MENREENRVENFNYYENALLLLYNIHHIYYNTLDNNLYDSFKKQLRNEILKIKEGLQSGIPQLSTTDIEKLDNCIKRIVYEVLGLLVEKSSKDKLDYTLIEYIDDLDFAKNESDFTALLQTFVGKYQTQISEKENPNINTGDIIFDNKGCPICSRPTRYFGLGQINGHVVIANNHTSFANNDSNNTVYIIKTNECGWREVTPTSCNMLRNYWYSDKPINSINESSLIKLAVLKPNLRKIYNYVIKQLKSTIERNINSEFKLKFDLRLDYQDSDHLTFDYFTTNLYRTIKENLDKFQTTDGYQYNSMDYHFIESRDKCSIKKNLDPIDKYDNYKSINFTITYQTDRNLNEAGKQELIRKLSELFVIPKYYIYLDIDHKKKWGYTYKLVVTVNINLIDLEDDLVTDIKSNLDYLKINPENLSLERHYSPTIDFNIKNLNINTDTIKHSFCSQMVGIIWRKSLKHVIKNYIKPVAVSKKDGSILTDYFGNNIKDLVKNRRDHNTSFKKIVTKTEYISGKFKKLQPIIEKYIDEINQNEFKERESLLANRESHYNLPTIYRKINKLKHYITPNPWPDDYYAYMELCISKIEVLISQLILIDTDIDIGEKEINEIEKFRFFACLSKFNDMIDYFDKIGRYLIDMYYYVNYFKNIENPDNLDLIYQQENTSIESPYIFSKVLKTDTNTLELLMKETVDNIVNDILPIKPKKCVPWRMKRILIATGYWEFTDYYDKKIYYYKTSDGFHQILNISGKGMGWTPVHVPKPVPV